VAHSDRADAEAFALIAEHTRDLIVRLSTGGRIAYVSPSVRRYGWAPEDLIGRFGHELVHPADAEILEQHNSELFAGDTEQEQPRLYRFSDPAGRWVWLEGSPLPVVSADGVVTEVIATLRDVTERRNLEESARAEARQFEAAFVNAPIGMALVSPEGACLRSNAAFQRILGYTEGELDGVQFQSITHPDDLPGDLELLGRLKAGEIETFQRDKRYLQRDGAPVWVQLSVTLVRERDGSPRHYVAQVIDLSERRAGLEAVAASEARYRLLAEHSQDIIVQLSTWGMITYASPAVRAYGYDPSDLVGRPINDFMHPDDLAANLENMLESARTGEAQSLKLGVARMRTAEGAWIWMEGNPRATRNAKGQVTGFVTTLRDVTERREKDALFEAAFQHSPMGKVLVTLDGRIARVNAAGCKMIDLPEAKILQMALRDIADPSEHGRDDALVGRLIAGEIDKYETVRRYRRGNDNRFVARMTVAIARHADGRPSHFVADVEDLTEKLEAEARHLATQERYRLIEENSSDIIVMARPNGKLTFVSPSVRAIGYEPQDLVGGTFAQYMHPADVDPVWLALSSMQPGERADPIRWRAKRGDTGELVWLESAPTMLKDAATGEPAGFLDVVRDVTASVEAESALASARAEAEAAAAAKAQFLANMSHEIRTPLTAVLGFTQLLKEMPDLPEEAARHIARIGGAGNGLLALVNDILDFSKLEAGRFEVRPRPTDVAAICDETLMMFSAQAEAKGLSLVLEVEPDADRIALLDPERLRQALINLIGNAVKFTEAGGVRLRVSTARRGRLMFEVIDTGPGLEPEALARLFQRFTQIDGSITRRHGGTGLGLAICRGVAEAMGGEVGVDSVPGSGSNFRLTVPAPRARRAERPERSGSLEISGLHVLVVDDNPVNRELARRMLDAAGACVEEACDADAALARLAQSPVDVVLMDLRMPGLDGRGALERLRAEPGPNSRTPVLAFTADADAAAQGDIASFDGLVRKPIQPIELFSAVAAAGLQAYETNKNNKRKTLHAAV
jgi:PAS domain S-box-containing protein